jgi:hypothetical protein
MHAVRNSGNDNIARPKTSSPVIAADLPTAGRARLHCSMHTLATTFERVGRDALDSVVPRKSGDSCPHNVAFLDIESTELGRTELDEPPESALPDPTPPASLHWSEKLHGDDVVVAQRGERRRIES